MRLGKLRSEIDLGRPVGPRLCSVDNDFICSFVCLFIEKGEGREKERERNTM